jgi:hypothetical protein
MCEAAAEAVAVKAASKTASISVKVLLTIFELTQAFAHAPYHYHLISHQVSEVSMFHHEQVYHGSEADNIQAISRRNKVTERCWSRREKYNEYVDETRINFRYGQSNLK